MASYHKLLVIFLIVVGSVAGSGQALTHRRLLLSPSPGSDSPRRSKFPFPKLMGGGLTEHGPSHARTVTSQPGNPILPDFPNPVTSPGNPIVPYFPSPVIPPGIPPIPYLPSPVIPAPGNPIIPYFPSPVIQPGNPIIPYFPSPVIQPGNPTVPYFPSPVFPPPPAATSTISP